MVLGALACGAAAWCLWPVAERARERTGGLRVCLVDASASVTATRPRWSTWIATALAEQALQAQASQEELLVVAFAEGVERWFGPAPADEFDFDAQRAESFERRAGSDLSAALAGLGELTLGRASGALRVRLFGDGTFTGADPSAALAQLREAGAEVRLVAARPAELVDLALVELRLPDELEAGAPLAARATIALADGLPEVALDVELRATVDDARGRREVVARVAVPPSAARAPWAAQVNLGAAAEGLTRVRATLRRADGVSDPCAENDSASASTRSRGAVVVGWLADPGARAAAARAMQDLGAAAGIEQLELAPAELAGALADLDVLATFDIDPRQLPGAELLAFVERGGGWLAAGGHALLEALGARERDVASAHLPLDIDDDQRPRDVLLCVDASGSMSGETFSAVRDAALELVMSARPADEVTLRFFTDHAEAPLALGQGGGAARERERAVRVLVEARAPGGPTDVLGVLAALAEERSASGRDALVLLLTDGRDQRQRGADAARARSVVEQLVAARARLVIVALGAGADLAFLRELERPELGIELWQPGAGELARVFDAELARGRVRSGERIGVAFATPGAQAPEWSAELVAALRGAASAALPPIARCLRTKARSGDGVLLVDDEGRPLLAVRRAGLGVAATWATLPGAPWAPEWGGERLLALWRALGRGRATGERLRASFEPPDGLRIDGAPPAWPERVLAEVRGRGVALANVALDVPLSAPGLDPRSVRAGPLPGALEGALELAVRSPAGEPLSVLALDLPVAEECRWPRRRVAAQAISEKREAGAAPAARARRPRAGAWLVVAGLLALAAGALLGAAARR